MFIAPTFAAIATLHNMPNNVYCAPAFHPTQIHACLTPPVVYCTVEPAVVDGALVGHVQSTQISLSCNFKQFCASLIDSDLLTHSTPFKHFRLINSNRH